MSFGFAGFVAWTDFDTHTPKISVVGWNGWFGDANINVKHSSLNCWEWKSRYLILLQTDGHVLLNSANAKQTVSFVLKELHFTFVNSISSCEQFVNIHNHVFLYGIEIGWKYYLKSDINNPTENAVFLVLYWIQFLQNYKRNSNTKTE